MIVLGLHGGVTIGQHEPSAALAIDGRIIALCEEERYLRIKSCHGYFPEHAIQACLERRSAFPLFGWKIAATSLDGQRHIGVDGPLAGRLLAERA